MMMKFQNKLQVINPLFISSIDIHFNPNENFERVFIVYEV